MLGIVQGFLGLVEVQIFGCASLTHQHDIRPPGELLAVEGIQKGTAGPVGFHHIPGHRPDDLLVGVQHHIDDEVHPHHGGGLLDVLPDRIAGELSRAGGSFHHTAVVGLDGIPGGDARHDGLGTAGVAGEVVVLDVAQADAPVRLRHPPVDVHRGTPGRGAHMDTVVYIQVHAADLPPGLLSRKMGHLFRGVLAVAAQGKYQRNVLRAHTGAVQFLQNRRQHGPGGHGPGDVAGDDGHLLTGADDLAQPGRPDGLSQRPAHLCPACQLHRHLVGLQHAQHGLVRHADRLGACADLE